MKKRDVKPNEYNIYFKKYIQLLNENIDLITGLEQNGKDRTNFISSIPSNKLEYRYKPEKWTIKEVIQHIIDTERVFTYRCFSIARKDKNKLLSFNENEYTSASGANRKTIKELINEFFITRNFTLSILKSLTDSELKQIGSVSNSNMSARACIFIILGHNLWHTNIIKERYL